MAKNTEARRNETESQRQIREYHEGDFQTKDPITGEARKLDQPVPTARLDRGETVEDVSPKRDRP